TGGETVVDGGPGDRGALADVGGDALPGVFSRCALAVGRSGPPPSCTVERLVLTVVVRLALEVGVGEIGAEGGDRGQRGAVGVEVVGQVVGLLELVLASLDTGADGSARIQTELLCM